MENKHTILVVEDDEDISRALKARLSHEGYNVAVAKDAISAVSIARQVEPTVALLDINMPGGDGFEVVRRIDRIAPGGMVRKVFMTASKDPELRQKALDAGATAFVEKPFTAETLLEAINQAINAEPPELFE